AVLASASIGSARETPPPSQFNAGVQVQIGGRQPLKLHAVIGELVAQEHLVGQRRVGEVPGVGVHFVLVADGREKAPGLEGEAVGETQGLDVCLFDFQGVVGRERSVERTAEIVV